MKKKQASFPVGKVNRLQLYPMSFKEFVIANDRMDLIEVFDEWPTDREIPKIYKEPMEELLKAYYINQKDNPPPSGGGLSICY
ncbi:MAG: hypothetical protein K5931_00095 [Lachnospiraceae bacterium]|nr:hypothetical protein [Lachnospiraceae bacterium]